MTNNRYIRLKQLLEPIKDKNIFLYGAGKRGHVALNNLSQFNMKNNVLGFIDDDCTKSFFCDLSVHQLSPELVEKHPSAVFIITTYAVKNMASSLLNNNVDVSYIYYFSELLVDDIDVDKIHKNRNKIKKVYSILADNTSKYIYKSIFDVYTLGNTAVLSRTQGYMQYFPIWVKCEDYIEDFVLKNECFIDCGAYIGDTTDAFLDIVANDYKKIYCFEPDKYNYSMLKQKYSGNSKVEMFPYGVYSKDGYINFSEGLGSSSEISENGKTMIAVRKIDSIIQDKVTFIKMDIEGAEQDALIGAKAIIKRDIPKLAICIYHKLEDLWEIPLLIVQMNSDYKIYIRNYEDRLDEIVCYAVNGEN